MVLTSSFAAIGYGTKGRTTAFTEEDWTNLNDPSLQPYQKSKTIAEREAWDFIARQGGGLELAVVNPVGVLGPVLGPDYSTSILLVKRLLDGTMPGCPDIWFGAVDVRDVVDLHLKAMTDPAARGERFLATGGDFVTGFCLTLGVSLLRTGLVSWYAFNSRAALPRLEDVGMAPVLQGLGTALILAIVQQVRDRDEQTRRRFVGDAIGYASPAATPCLYDG